jgi:putative transposase
LPRYTLPSFGVFHLTARGVNRCPIVIKDDDCAFFVALLRQVVREQNLECHAYCVMPNHYHAIVEAPLTRISKAMHRLNGVHAQRFNEIHERTGHLFQGRFHAQVIRDDEHFGNACEYVWNNPVRSGLCVEAHDWPWSGRILRSRVNGR